LPAGVGELVRTRLDASPEFVAACFETTSGNPLLLTELLRASAFEGRAEEAEVVRTTVPGTVARTVTARIRRLSPGGRPRRRPRDRRARRRHQRPPRGSAGAAGL
jgi:hypothetical protein